MSSSDEMEESSGAVPELDDNEEEHVEDEEEDDEEDFIVASILDHRGTGKKEMWLVKVRWMAHIKQTTWRAVWDEKRAFFIFSLLH